MFPRLSLLLFLGFIACSSSPPAFAPDGNPAPLDMETSADSSYGYSAENPIRVGGARTERGPQNERSFLDALRGPAGQVLTYRRAGSCCPFTTRNAVIFDAGALDIYEVSYEGLTKPVTLFINMYDYQRPLVPVGFTRRH